MHCLLRKYLVGYSFSPCRAENRGSDRVRRYVRFAHEEVGGMTAGIDDDHRCGDGRISKELSLVVEPKGEES